MDSDSSQQQPPPPHHHHHHHHPPHHPQPPIMVGPTTNSYPTPTPTTTITTTSTTTTTTASTAPPPPTSATTITTTLPVMSQQHQIQTQHHQTQNPNPNPNMPRFPFNSMVNSSSSAAGPALDYSDGSGSSPRASGFSIEPARKKRGRPRKYSPDGNIALGLSPTPVTVMSPVGGGSHGDYSGGGTPSSEPPAKRSRGRPPGSGKKQLNALGTTGVGFTPHVITVKAGEDIASKVMAFAQQGPRTVCILSANGSICNVTLRQSAMSGGTVTYEGRFEIISLSGSFIPSESNGSRNRTGGLSVSLAGSDGRVLGGGVAGMLMAASPVQVVVGSFIADGKKSKSGPPSGLASNLLNFGAPVTAASPPSQGASSDSSDENGGSPLNHGPGPYSNAGQPMSMPMYTNMGWPNSTIKMHPN